MGGGRAMIKVVISQINYSLTKINMNISHVYAIAAFPFVFQNGETPTQSTETVNKRSREKSEKKEISKEEVKSYKEDFAKTFDVYRKAIEEANKDLEKIAAVATARFMRTVDQRGLNKGDNIENESKRTAILEQIVSTSLPKFAYGIDGKNVKVDLFPKRNLKEIVIKMIATKGKGLPKEYEVSCERESSIAETASRVQIDGKGSSFLIEASSSESNSSIKSSLSISFRNGKAGEFRKMEKIEEDSLIMSSTSIDPERVIEPQDILNYSSSFEPRDNVEVHGRNPGGEIPTATTAEFRAKLPEHIREQASNLPRIKLEDRN
jgi:hypothetical protein